MLQCVVVCCSECHNYSASLHGKCLSGSCSVLQWVAMCCSVLQYVALDCNVLQCVKANTPSEYSIRILHPFLSSIPFHCTASAFQCITMYCNVLQCVAVEPTTIPLHCTASASPFLSIVLSSPLPPPTPPPASSLSVPLSRARLLSFAFFLSPFLSPTPCPPQFVCCLFLSIYLSRFGVCHHIPHSQPPPPHSLTLSPTRALSLAHTCAYSPVFCRSLPLSICPTPPHTLSHALSFCVTLTCALAHMHSRTCARTHVRERSLLTSP